MMHGPIRIRIKITLPNGVLFKYLIVRTLSRNVTSFVALTLLTQSLIFYVEVAFVVGG